MEFLQPETTSMSSKRQSVQRRKVHQNEKTGNTKNTTGEVKTQLHHSDEKSLVTTTQPVTKQENKEQEREKPRISDVSPPSSAVDDAWDFLSDSPQKVAVETTNQKVWYITHSMNELE